MVLEFLLAFGETFDLKNEFPDGISLGENLQRLFDSHLFQSVAVSYRV